MKFVPIYSMYPKIINIQQHQAINLLILLIIGKLTLYYYLSWAQIALILLFTLLAEHIFIYLKKQKLTHFSISSLSSAMGVILMLNTAHLWIYLVVITLALMQKHFVLLYKRHLFNPSNFALLMALLLFHDKAYIVLGQLGDESWLLVIILVMGAFVLYRANRWVIPVAFSLTYLFLEYLLVTVYDPVVLFEQVIYRFISISFIVFILFMLTDPRTTPSKLRYQLLFGALIAIGASVLDFLYGFRVQHLFLSLALFSVTTPLIELWCKPESRTRLAVITLPVMAFVIYAILFIQSKPPYFVVMDV